MQSDLALYNNGTMKIIYNDAATSARSNLKMHVFVTQRIILQYDYDYSELTEKPSTTTGQQQQWPATNTTTIKPAHSGIASGQANSSGAYNNSLGSINSSAIVITNQLLATPEHVNATTIDQESAVKIRKCAPGYYRDNLGRCRSRRKPHIP